jgi:hypothetical protein
MKAPTTDTTLGITPDHTKFRDVRQKAQDEYTERAKGRKKDPAAVVPKYTVGDRVVLVDGYSHKHYHLIEIVDFFQARKNSKDFSYFGIMLKTTDKDMLHRAGRLIKTSEMGYYRMPRIENVPADSVKWLED